MSDMIYSHESGQRLQALDEPFRKALRDFRRTQNPSPEDFKNLVHLCLDALDAIEEMDLKLHYDACEMTGEEYEKAEMEYEFASMHLLLHTSRVLLLCRKYGIFPDGFERLEEGFVDWYGVFHWDTADYAESPAFQALAEHAVREYEAGRYEEGGWEL